MTEQDKLKEDFKKLLQSDMIIDVTSSCEQHGLRLTNCIECVREGIDKGFNEGKKFEHKNSCRDKSNCRVCKGEVEL